MRSYALPVALFFLLTLFSCGSDDSSDDNSNDALAIADIQGNWSATSFVFDKVCDPGVDCPSQSVDIIALGFMATLSIQANGRFIIISTEPGGGGEAITGQMSFDDDLLVMEFDDSPGEEEFFGIQLTDNDNNLRIEGPVEYDFDDDGTDEPARVTINLVRA